jgi:capsular polysaccharide biosynthesis protein
MEKRVAQLKETERYKTKAAEQKWENRIIGLILGLGVGLIVVLLRKYLSS